MKCTSKILRKAMNKEAKQSISENQRDMKCTSKILRKAMNKEAKQSDFETIFVDNEEVNDKQEIFEWLNDHFITIGEKLAKDIPQSSKSSLEYISKSKKNENKFKFKMLKPMEIYTI